MAVITAKNKTYEDYYYSKYDPQYYVFDKYELEINPYETLEEVAAYSSEKQIEEIKKCCRSFNYFCHKYIKILHPVQGLIPFVLYKYQTNCIHDYENHRFNIIRKFRQGGLTTVTLLWGLWRCMFKLDQQVMLLSKTDREATDIGMIVDRAIENMPEWIKPKKDAKWNDHLKMFTETGGSIKFYSPEAARGKAVTFLIIDEAAFIPDMETHWKAMWPVLSTGGSCSLVSTVNGMGNWYHDHYVGAIEKRNLFHAIDLDYKMHPNYNDPKWLSEQKAQLGEKGFLQEVLCEFLGSGETYISAKTIKRLTEETISNFPIKKLFSQWTNTSGPSFHIEGEFDKGALWVWKEPIVGREYIMGVDVGEGKEENNDNSCIEVLDSTTLEQVAEFYSNQVPVNVFSMIVDQIGKYYNNALAVIEDMGPGGSVLNYLQHVMPYDNLYYENTRSKQEKPGVKMSRTNRPQLLECMENRLLNETVKINSYRFVQELQTFQFSPKTKKAEAAKGKHDDAIISIALALYVRDSMMRDIPIGADVPKDANGMFRADIYEKIKDELEDDSVDSWLQDDDAEDVLASPQDSISMWARMYRRKNNNLLAEFRW